MKFGHLNVRSLTSGFNHFNDFIISENFDVFGVSETWLTNGILNDSVSIKGYFFVRADRGSRGGGVGIYINRKIKFRQIFNKIEPHSEQLWISLNLKGKKYSIGIVYRPPKGHVVSFIETLENSISELIPTCDSILVAGDMNINLLSPNIRSVELFNDFIIAYNLNQIISEPTRITGTSSSLLDVIMVSEDVVVNSVTVNDLHTEISDHCVTACRINKIKEKKSSKLVTFRDFKNFNDNNFSAFLQNINWDHIYNLTCTNTMVEYLTQKIIEVFDIFAPICTKRVSKPPAPWLTDTIKDMIKIRDRAYARFKKSKQIEHFDYYKELRNYTAGAIKREKRAHMEYVMRNKSSKETWNTLRSLQVVKNKTNTEIPSNLENVDEINKNFTAVPVVNKSNHQLSLLNKYNRAHSQHNVHFQFSQITSNETRTQLNSIKSFATGSDHISLTMLHLIFPHLSDHITHIINTVLSSNIFPDAWKKANVLPLAKVSNPENFGQLRPISILPTLSKILERIMHKQMSEYVLLNNIIPTVQSGFRPKHSTTTALINITDDILRNHDKGMATCLVLLDYSKAFDTLDHRILCNKLSYFGFSNSSVSLIQSFLSDRSQRVVYNALSSSPLKIQSGVPQGSILSPLLFSIYTADFYSVLNNCKIHHYADDTQIYLEITNLHCATANEHINSDLKALVDISCAHNLKLNALKSSVTLFGPKKLRNIAAEQLQINVDGQNLAFVAECKNLGVWFDTNLRFTKHVNYLCQTSYTTLKFLYNSREILNSALKLKLCEALIISKLSYCDSVYGSCLTVFDKNRLQKIQNSCFRFAFGIRKYDSTRNKILESGRLRLDKLRHLHLLTLGHRILENKQPTYLLNKLTKFKHINNLNTRNRNLMVIPKHTTAVFKNSFTFQFSSNYNDIPNDFYDYNILNFKKKLKLQLLSQA